MSQKNKGFVISNYRSYRDFPEGASGRLGTAKSVLYPNSYTWFVFLAALDVMLTWIILRYDGHELNVLANFILAFNGLAGMVGFKLLLVAFVLTMCEIVGRRDLCVGRRLAQLCVAVTAVPVVLALTQLFIAKQSLV